MEYWKTTEKWASAPLIVTKYGEEWFRLTVDLPPVKKFTVRHNFAMPNIEQEKMVKNGIPGFFALMELIHVFMEKVNGRSGERTKLSVSRIRLIDLG